MSPRLKSVYNACHKTRSGIAIGEISDATPTDSIGLATGEGGRIRAFRDKLIWHTLI